MTTKGSSLLDLVQRADTLLFLAVNQSCPAWLGWIFLLITFMGSLYAVPIWLAVVTWRAWREARVKAGVYVLLSVSGAMAVDFVLKALTSRPRPWRVLPATHVIGPLELSYSLPSGHTTAAAALAVAVGVAWPRTRRITFPLALLIALSRLVVGAHYPSDVLSALALGGCVAWVLSLFRFWALRTDAAFRTRPNAAGPTL